jgi:small-conductance mechanosensitive channel
MTNTAGRRRSTSAIKIVVWIWLALLTAASGYPQQAPPAVKKEASTSAAIMARNLQTALAAETRNLEKIKRQAQELEKGTGAFQSELDSYRIQLAAFNSMLFIAQTPMADLEEAAAVMGQSLGAIEGMVTDKTAQRKSLKDLCEQAARQISLYKKNADATLPELKSIDTEDAGGILDRLVTVISEKQRHLDQMTDLLDRQLEDLSQLKQEFTTQALQFKDRIDAQRNRQRFERRSLPFYFQGWSTLQSEIESVRAKLINILNRSHLIERALLFWTSGGLLFLAATVLYAAFITALRRLKRRCATFSHGPYAIAFPWRSTAVRLLYQSMFLAGSMAFLFTYTTIRGIYDQMPAIQVTVHILVVLLYTRWGLDLLDIWREATPPRLPMPLLKRLRSRVRVIRYAAVVYMVMQAMLATEAVLLILYRLALGGFLLLCLFTFKAHWDREIPPAHPMRARKWPLIERYGFMAASAVIVFALVLELTGYGILAAYWLLSWSHTAVVLLWLVISFFVLKEWDQKFYMLKDDAAADVAQPVKWLAFRMSWLTWTLGGTLLIVLAWGGQKAVFSELGRVVGNQIAIGDFKISLLGVLHACLILFFTHTIVRLWRYVLQGKILDDSGLETGLKSSIVTINIYILWGIGIIIALSALGVSGTSLTVAFGAISIGLGFGMQNIFNNFISGIIMLFERPIQVGDAIEINGVWGEVKKINFRSTIVQTYDNASLIIPNSDFISNQVTNWSFRDQRLRVSVQVGVAYGSQIEMVRETLLAVADRTPNVRQTPKPDVLFQDFGDSALIFKLRVWTDIANMLKVATAIRFDIDKAFKEKGIEIPFPQHDLHLRSIDDTTRLKAPVKT